MEEAQQFAAVEMSEEQENTMQNEPCGEIAASHPRPLGEVGPTRSGGIAG